MSLHAVRSTGRTTRRAGAVAALVGLVVSALVVGDPGPVAAAPAAATAPGTDPTVVFADGFEQGNAWTYWTNGSNGAMSLVSDPVHGGSGALQITAGANPGQPEIGLAAIRDGLAITEDSSELSFWYYATGDATYRNLSVEAHTASAGYYTILPDPVVTGRWEQASVRLTDISADLAGATVAELVIKPVTAPDAGSATVTLDDITVTNGVVPAPEPPAVLTTTPPTGATSVPVDRVLTATVDQPLDPSSVNAGTARLTTAAGLRVPAQVRYLAGQPAVAVVPDRPLAAGTSYRLTLDGLASAAGLAMPAPVTAEFSTGSAGNRQETEFGDDFAGLDGWRGYSNAAGGFTQGLADGRPPSGQALTIQASDPAAPFVLSDIHDVACTDQNTSISFDYRVSGTARPADLVVMLTGADGRIAAHPLLAGKVPVGTWSRLSARVADLAPTMVGQRIATIEIKAELAGPGDARFDLDNVAVTSRPADFAVNPRTGDPDSLPAATLARIASLADHIVALQNPDGSIPDGTTAPWNTTYVGYDSTYSVLGLVRAYQVTGRRAYLDAAQRYVDWYRAHLNADGTMDDYQGSYPDLVDTGDYDSSDSYASTYLLLLWRMASVQPTRAARQGYLRAVYPTARRVYGALDAVYRSNGLTEAKPSYPVQYIEDNAETWFGEVAMSRLAAAAGDRAQARLADQLAARTLYAIRGAYLRSDYGDYGTSVTKPNYAVAPSGPLVTWYPDALSNVLLLAVAGGGPGQPAGGDRALLADLVDRFDVGAHDQRPITINDTPQYMWWAMAADAVGDRATARHFVDEYTATEGEDNPATLGITAGHLIRILAYPYDNSLWF